MSSRLLENGKSLRDLGWVGDIGKGDAQGDTVLDGLGGALALVREHGVGGVADDDEFGLCPFGDGGAVEEGPAFDFCCFAWGVLGTAWFKL